MTGGLGYFYDAEGDFRDKVRLLRLLQLLLGVEEPRQGVSPVRSQGGYRGMRSEAPPACR